MPELPWKKFFPQDWRGDPSLSRCSATTRGVWIDAISAMMLLGTDRLTGTDAELARDCRCEISEIYTAHKELQHTKTADVSMQNGCKTWVCRRLSRELEISKIRAVSASKRWSKTDAKGHAKGMQDVNANTHASSASASAYASASVPEGECEGKHFPEVNGYPTLAEVKALAQIIGLAEWKAVDWFDEMNGCGWLDYNHRPIRDPRSVLNRVKVKWEADGRPMSPPSRISKDRKQGKIAV